LALSPDTPALVILPLEKALSIAALVPVLFHKACLSHTP